MIGEGKTIGACRPAILDGHRKGRSRLAAASFYSLATSGFSRLGGACRPLSLMAGPVEPTSAKGFLWSPPIPPGVNASLYGGGESHMGVV